MLAMLVLTIIASCIDSFRTFSRIVSISGNNAAQTCSIWPLVAAIMQLCLDLQDPEKLKAEERKQSISEGCNTCLQDVGECEGQDQDTKGTLQKEVQAVSCNHVYSLIE